MKKVCLFSIVILLLLLCLPSCNLGQQLTDSLENESKSKIKVEEMFTYLSENDVQNAKALIHSNSNFENVESAIKQMIDYIDGREAVSFELDGINVRTSVSTSGNEKQEDVCYIVTLSDQSIIYINATYISNNSGEGFYSYQISFGLI